MAFIKSRKKKYIECLNCNEKFLGNANSKYCLKCKDQPDRKRICKKCGIKLSNMNYTYCNSCLRKNNEEMCEKEKEYAKKRNLKKYPEYRKNEEYRLQHKKAFKQWYQNNKDKQKENVQKDYNKNKEKWKERNYVARHKKEILRYINTKCFMCGKEEIKEIHHTKYDNLPKKNLKEYCKFLIGFCSRGCHRSFESGLPQLKNDTIIN